MRYDEVRVLADAAQHACIRAWADIRALGPVATGSDEAAEFEIWTDHVVGLGTHASRPAEDDPREVTFDGIEHAVPLKRSPVWRWALEHAASAPQVLGAALVVDALREAIVNARERDGRAGG